MEAVMAAIVFGSIFGVFYLYFSTRNKERLALIEKGADASIFLKGRNESKLPFWKVFLLNLSFLLMGIGVGVFIALILDEYSSLGEGIYPALIFLTAGIGLYLGFNQTRKLE